HSGRIDPQLGAKSGEDRLQLGGEHDTVAAPQNVHRFDAERVAGQGKAAGGLVGDGEREHSAEPGKRVRSPGAPGFEDNLGGGVGAKPDAGGLKLATAVAEVVQLAVVAAGQPPLAHRLVGGFGQVDDRQPVVCQVG